MPLPFAGYLSRPLDALRSYVGSVSWGPLVTFSRSTVLGVLQQVQNGQIVLIDTDGTRIVCGQDKLQLEEGGGPRTEIRVRKETFWVRVLLFADMVR
jgi:cyclopropane-fatty-acyl-phospholipid synthase